MIADAQQDDEVELTDISVDVSAIRRVRGRGNIRFEAAARIDIGGVVVEILGVTLRAETNSHLGCYLPHYRCSNGTWTPAIRLPAVVERAVARAALEQAGGIIIAEPVREHDVA